MSLPVTCLSLRLSVKQLRRRGVAGELEGQQPLHETSCPHLCSRFELLDQTSPGLQAVAFSSVAKDVQRFPEVLIMSKECSVERLSSSGPSSKPAFMTRVSAAEFFVAFVRLPVVPPTLRGCWQFKLTTHAGKPS